MCNYSYDVSIDECYDVCPNERANVAVPICTQFGEVPGYPVGIVTVLPYYRHAKPMASNFRSTSARSLSFILARFVRRCITSASAGSASMPSRDHRS
jgi:hypothetical protein